MREIDRDPEFTAWRSLFLKHTRPRQIEVSEAVTRFLYDDGLDPSEAADPKVLARYNDQRTRPITASASDIRAAFAADRD